MGSKFENFFSNALLIYVHDNDDDDDDDDDDDHVWTCNCKHVIANSII